MDEKKIAWKRVEGKYAWIGVRGRFTFFTLRFSPQEPDAWENVSIEHADVPFVLTYHADNGRQEKLNPMHLAEAQAHAERELDEWLAKTYLIDLEPPTPANQAVESARAIVEACVNDGVKSIMDPDDQDRLATRIAFYAMASVMGELGKLHQQAIDEGLNPVAALLTDRRAELAETFRDLGEILR